MGSERGALFSHDGIELADVVRRQNLVEHPDDIANCSSLVRVMLLMTTHQREWLIDSINLTLCG